MRIPERLCGLPSAPGALVWALALVGIPLSRIVSDNFPSLSQVQSILTLALFLAVVAFGQGLVVLTGGVDLSLSSTVSLAAFAVGLLASDGVPLVVAVVAALACCAVVGAINGLLVARAGFPPFITTLAVGTVLASILLGVSQGTPAQPSPEPLTRLFRGTNLLGIPLPVWIFVLIVVIGATIQSSTTLGRRAYAVGNSTTAARIAGIKVESSIVLVYVVAAMVYGVAGILLLGYSSGADLNIGGPWLLPSLAAVVLGGSAIRGGSGSYVATAGGAVLLTIFGIDISAAGIAEGYKQVVYGLVILLALAGGQLRGRPTIPRFAVAAKTTTEEG